MRGSPLTLQGAALASAFTVIGFVLVALLMLRRARDPGTRPLDEVERLLLRRIKDPSRREKWFFAFGVALAGAAPWLSWRLER